MPSGTRRGASVEWLNLFDYGIAGNGILDETLGVANWIKAASAGDILYIPSNSVWKYNQAALPAVPYGCTVLGDGPYSVLMPTGAGQALSCHGTGTGVAYTPIFQMGGLFDDFVIDGSSSVAGAIGLDIGDGWLRTGKGLQIRHFNGAGSIGLNIINRNIWTEKSDFAAALQDNTSNVVIDALGPALPSHMYSDYRFYIFAQPGQDGITIRGGSEPSRCNFRVRGNFQSSSGTPGAVLRITDAGTHLTQCDWDLGVESDGALANGPIPVVQGDATNTFTQMTGRMSFLSPGGATAFQNSTLLANFNFRGVITGDSALSNQVQPAVPASDVVFTNHGPDAMVYISGGTVSQVRINGNITNLTSGSFLVLGNSGTIQITYTVAPTWRWIWWTQGG